MQVLRGGWPGVREGAAALRVCALARRPEPSLGAPKARVPQRLLRGARQLVERGEGVEGGPGRQGGRSARALAAAAAAQPPVRRAAPRLHGSRRAVSGAQPRGAARRGSSGLAAWWRRLCRCAGGPLLGLPLVGGLQAGAVQGAQPIHHALHAAEDDAAAAWGGLARLLQRRRPCQGHARLRKEQPRRLLAWMRLMWLLEEQMNCMRHSSGSWRSSRAPAGGAATRWPACLRVCIRLHVAACRATAHCPLRGVPPESPPGRCGPSAATRPHAADQAGSSSACGAGPAGQGDSQLRGGWPAHCQPLLRHCGPLTSWAVSRWK